MVSCLLWLNIQPIAQYQQGIPRDAMYQTVMIICGQYCLKLVNKNYC